MIEGDTIGSSPLAADTAIIYPWQGQSIDTTEKMESITFPVKPGISSFFTEHALRTKQLIPGPTSPPQPEWIAFLLLLCFILLAFVQVFDRKRLAQIVRAPVQKRFFSQLIREGNLFSERITVTLGLIYFISLMLLVYSAYIMLIGLPPFYLHGFSFFMVIGICLVLYWGIKIFIIRLLGNVFRTYLTTREYMLNILVFNLNSGLILLPLLVLIVYLNSIELLYTGLIIIVLVVLFRFFRGFLIGIGLTKFSYLYLFVYLCSLEILPLIVLFRFFLNHIHVAIRMN